MASQLRFVVDVNVGRLAKWLRVMGYDTLFPEDQSDNGLVRLALRDDRVLVTRDSGIALRRAVRLGQMRMVLIVDDDPRRQLHQLVKELGLTVEQGFSRCILCNEPLLPVAKERVAAQLPRYVLQTQHQFMQCPHCQRVYWRGTHWANMVAELDQVYQEII